MFEMMVSNYTILHPTGISDLVWVKLSSEQQAASSEQRAEQLSYFIIEHVQYDICCNRIYLDVACIA